MLTRKAWLCGSKLQPAGAVYFAMDEDDVRRVIAYPHAMIGSDGLPNDEVPHPRLCKSSRHDIAGIWVALFQACQQ